MLLVIIGHTQPPEILATAIYGVHMPLFFFVSGMLWRGQVNLGHSTRSLWLPFIGASLASWIFWLMKQHIQGNNSIPWWGPLLATAYGGNIDGFLVHNTPLWFLPAMLSLLTMIWLLQRTIPQSIVLTALTTISLTIILISPSFDLAECPMSLAQGLAGGVFFSIGHSAKKWISATKPVITITLPLIATAISLKNGHVDLFSLNFQNPLLYLLSGTLGSIAIVAACSNPKLQHPLLCTIGEQSLFVLAIHLPLIWLLRAGARVSQTPETWWLLSTSCCILIAALTTWRKVLSTKSFSIK